MKKYRTIIADPPWPYNDGWPGWMLSRKNRLSLPYPSMTIEEIKALQVAAITETEGYLFLWTTNRYLEIAFNVIRAWSFTPRQTLTWCKPPRGKGPGGMFATTTEFVIIAQRVGPKSHARGKRTNGIRIDTSWFQWHRKKHSAKPEEFINMVEKICPGPYLELFARPWNPPLFEARPNWDVWGNEVKSNKDITRVLNGIHN